MNCAFAEKNKFVTGLSPSADVIAGGVASDVVLARNYEKVIFLLSLKSGGTNTGVGAITVQATAANTTGSPTAVAFKYSKLTAGTDGQGSLTAATSAGISNTANEDAVFIIEVDPRDLPDDKPYVHLAVAESVNDPLLGSCIIICHNSELGLPMPAVLA